MTAHPLTIKFITENSKFVLARLRCGNATLLAILDQDLDIIGISNSNTPLLIADKQSAIETLSRTLNNPKYGASYKAYKCFEMGGLYFLNTPSGDNIGSGENKRSSQYMYWEATVSNPTLNTLR